MIKEEEASALRSMFDVEGIEGGKLLGFAHPNYPITSGEVLSVSPANVIQSSFVIWRIADSACTPTDIGPWRIADSACTVYIYRYTPLEAWSSCLALSQHCTSIADQNISAK